MTIAAAEKDNTALRTASSFFMVICLYISSMPCGAIFILFETRFGLLQISRTASPADQKKLDLDDQKVAAIGSNRLSIGFQSALRRRAGGSDSTG
ncbi:hypothetical protein HUU39_21135 [candidate division KSB1 bacterium]|nr:hypothetical protein [candidate division KSB1 bacterium]